LEYCVDPCSIEIELRIYQRDEVRVDTPFGEEIIEVMDKIVLFDQQVEQLKASERY
jgi:hypothetical protein